MQQCESSNTVGDGCHCIWQADALHCACDESSRIREVALSEERSADVKGNSCLQPFACPGSSCARRGECGMAVRDGLALHVSCRMGLHSSHPDGGGTGLLPCHAGSGPELACSNRIRAGAGICIGSGFAGGILGAATRI